MATGVAWLNKTRLHIRLRCAYGCLAHAAARKLDHGFYLLTIQAVIPFHDVVEARSRFQVLEDGRDGHARAFQNPGAAHFTGNALHCRTARPVEICHGELLHQAYRSGAKRKRPATTYSPTHFRVQYNPAGLNLGLPAGVSARLLRENLLPKS